MHLLEAIKLYCHLVQASGGGVDGRKTATDALKANNVSDPVIDAIGETVSNEGNLVGQDGGRFAITQIAAS